MESYKEMKRRHASELAQIEMFFAFDKDQYRQGLEKLNAEEGEITAIGAGGYIRKSDRESLLRLMDRQARERLDAIAEDKDGTGYIYQMFLTELNNHEFAYTGDTEETLDALNLTPDTVEASEPLREGLKKAIRTIQAQDLPF